MKIFALAACFWAAGLSVSAQSAHEWRDSLSVLMRQIEQDPSSVDLRLRKAAVNVELGQWDYAEAEYGRVLKLETDNLAALYYRAYVYVNLRRYSLAKEDYEHFLRLSPFNMQARLGLATVHEKMGHDDEARRLLNETVQFNPDSAIAYAARAVFQQQRSEYTGALHDWKEAIRRNQRNTDYVVSAVNVLLTIGRKEEARRMLEDAVNQGVPRGVLKGWFDRCK